MEKIAVFVDDAQQARTLLAPMLARGAAPVHWIVVACAPRLTHRIGKWVSNAGREQFRDRWVRTLRDELDPLFADAQAADREWLTARGPLEREVERLRTRHGRALRLLDARRPRAGVALSPLGPSPAPRTRWAAPVAVSSSLSIVLALTD